MSDPALASDAIGAVGFLFALVLLPTVRNAKAFVPRSSSGLTCAGLAVVAVAFASLSLWVACASEVAGVAVWLALFVWRGGPR